MSDPLENLGYLFLGTSYNTYLTYLTYLTYPTYLTCTYCSLRGPSSNGLERGNIIMSLLIIDLYHHLLLLSHQQCA